MSKSKASKKYKDFRYDSEVFIPCYYCGRPLDREHATTEHIKPLAYGANHKPDNLAICCAKCNNNHGAILSCNLNIQKAKTPNNKIARKSMETANEYRNLLNQRKNFWIRFNSFTIFNFLESERTFAGADISTYHNAAYYYSGTYTLDELNLSDLERTIIKTAFYYAFP